MGAERCDCSRECAASSCRSPGSFDLLTLYMPMEIPESDWRRFKEVHTSAEERYCERIIEEVAAIGSRSTEASAPARCMKVTKLIKDRDKQLATAFGNYRRSTAVMQLGLMRRMKLLTDEELGLFTEQTRARIEGIASL
jgi:hypothetical protein